MSIIDFFKEAFKPNPHYGLTIEQQHAKQANKQAKLEKIRREWLENVYPEIEKEIRANSLKNPPSPDE